MSTHAFSEILLRLPATPIRVNQNEVKTCCWHHCDNTPSLYITDKPDSVLMYCFGCGASADVLLSGLGLPISALFDNYWTKESQLKKSNSKYLEELREGSLQYIFGFSEHQPSTLRYKKINDREDRLFMLAELKKKVDGFVRTLKPEQRQRLYGDFSILYNVVEKPDSD